MLSLGAGFVAQKVAQLLSMVRLLVSCRRFSNIRRRSLGFPKGVQVAVDLHLPLRLHRLTRAHLRRSHLVPLRHLPVVLGGNEGASESAIAQDSLLLATFS